MNLTCCSFPPSLLPRSWAPRNSRALAMALAMLVWVPTQAQDLLNVTPAMLSGPLNFIYTPAGTTFASPIPYGVVNNVTDQGWIWPSENTGSLAVDFGSSMIVTRFRVFCTYNTASRGATWAIESSPDNTNWTAVANFDYLSTYQGGVDDAGNPIDGYAGWYAIDFNAEGAEARFWRISQTAVLAEHAPRCAQMEFYGFHGSAPTVKSASPQGGGIRGDASLAIELWDGAASRVATDSIQLTLDGEIVTPVVSRPAGETVTLITFDPPGRLKVGNHHYEIAFSDNATPPARQTQVFDFVVIPDEQWIVTPEMLSGNFTFFASPAIGAFSAPVPYGTANNVTDAGWIWVLDSYLDINFGTPIALSKLRAFSTYGAAPRGAVWAIETSSDGVTYDPVGEFVFETRPGGGVNDDGTPRADCAGWYDGLFNMDGAITAQFWRIRQTGVTIQHAPRVAQLAFYSALPNPGVKSFSPTGYNLGGDTVIQAELVDGISAVDAATIRLLVNGQAVQPTIDKPEGSFITTLTYDPPGELSRGVHSVRLIYGNQANPTVLQTNDWSFRVAVAPLTVCPSMLSGPLNFIHTPGTVNFGEPIPYGFANNVNDNGWIWPNDNTGFLEVDFGIPAAVNGFRVYVTYTGAARGANWAIEYSNDQATWTLATNFRFLSSAGGGVNDDFTPRADFGGWYEVNFNPGGEAAGRFWRVRQTEVLAEHAPRVGQIEFYGGLTSPLPVTMDMLSGTLDFYATPGGVTFADPIPYGFANNVTDSGWIWPRDNTGVLQVDFGHPQILNLFRVWASYAPEARGALWIIESSDDANEWIPVTDFTFETASGAGLNDSGCKRTDFCGWYGVMFNPERIAAQFWRIRQMQETITHAPRCAQVQFYELAVPAEVLSLNFARAGGNLTISWTDSSGSAILQWAPAVNGPWENLTATSPYTIGTSGGNKFYRLKK